MDGECLAERRACDNATSWYDEGTHACLRYPEMGVTQSLAADSTKLSLRIEKRRAGAALCDAADGATAAVEVSSPRSPDGVSRPSVAAG